MTGPVTTDALVEARALIRHSLKVGAPGLSETAREAVLRSIMLKLEGKVLAPFLASLQQVTAERDADRAEHARYRASAEEMWETTKRHGGQMLAEKRRADAAEASLATANAELARLRAEVEAKDRRTALADRVKAQLEVAQNALVKIDRGGKPMREIAAQALLDVAMVPYPAEPAKPAADAPWPTGCIKPNACSRHRTCVYAMSAEKCRHFGEDLGPAIEAAEAARAATAREG